MFQQFSEDLRTGWRFFRSLPGFLNRPLSVQEALQRVELRFERRAARLAALLRQLASTNPENPYRRLLDHSGFEAGDADRLLRKEGVEGLLQSLYGAGVFLASDEFKGREPVRRGSLEFMVEPAELLNPGATVHGLAQSSGSRGKPTPVPIDLASIEDHAVNTLLALHAYGGSDWVHAHYGVPGGTSVTNPLEFAKGGRPPERWFTPVDPAAPGLHHRYRFAARGIWLGSRLAGVPMPGPTVAPTDRLDAVAHWMEQVLGRGNTPHLWTVASTAVLVCQAAATHGIDIAGARFTAGGEPTTRARRQAVEATGAVIIPRMGTTETDILSYGCMDAQAADDMHFFDDRHALIQPGTAPGANLPPEAMMLTSLLPSAPLILLNVCMGDQASVTRRTCACPLDGIGWRTHLSEVRSFEKLTAGGLTFLDLDVIRVLEEVMPARFGGSGLDYQLVERADRPSGRGQIQLLVNPALGELDTSELIDVFLTALGGGTGGERLMELQWRSNRVVEVVREPVRHTASGKILHLHLQSGRS